MSSKQSEVMSSPLRSVRSAKSSKSNPRKELSLGDIEHPQKVRVLILTEQKLIFQQYYYLKNFTQIIKLDLSYNKIVQFPQGFSFKNFQNLKTLFLHYNKFDKLKNLQLLADCKKIVYLTLFGNPLEETRARHFCLNIIPSLKLMDDKPVKQEEKYQGILNFQLNSHNDRVGFPLIQISEKESSLEFLSSVMREIKMAKDFYMNVNPIITIQKWWKKICKKKKKYRKFIQQTKIQITQHKKEIPVKVNNQSESQKNIDVQSVFILKRKNILSREGKEQEEGSYYENLEKRHLKVVHCFETVFEGLKSFEILLKQETSLFCLKQYCVLNGYAFRQSQKFRNKYVHVYSTPFSNTAYNLKRQKQKHFLSLIFYNNFSYLIELKSRRPFKSRTQLKNSQVQNKTELQSSNSLELVQIDLSKEQKIKLLKNQYFKCKLPQSLKPFTFLFGINLLKISAAIKIQKRWRGYKVRQNFNALQKVRQKFAAIKIQKWIRKQKFQNRRNFLIQSSMFLKNNQSPNIVMKLETFCSLHQVYQKILEKDTFMKLPFQECDFQIVENLNEKSLINQLENGEQISLGSKKIKTEITLFAPRQPFPSYFSKFIQPYQLGKQNSLDEEIDTKKFRIIDLLIKGAIQVKRFQSFTYPKSKQKCNYVKFEYLNKQDANQRKFLLCLLTYSFRNKRWVPFHSEKDTEAKLNFTDINEQIRSTHFVKMIYDNDKQEKLFDKIQKYTKEIQNKSEVSWMPVKIRYFEGTVDYSSIIIVGIYKKGWSKSEKSKIEENDDGYELAASRKRLKELNSLKTLQNKIALNNFDTKILTPMNAKSQINRNLVNFSLHLENQSDRESIHSKNQYDYQRQKFFMSLHNDNSQISLLDDSGPRNSIESYGSSLPMKTNLDQSIIKNEKSILDSSMSDKKLFIQKIKSSHRQNIEMMTQLRKRKTQTIRKQYQTNAEENKKLIRESSNSSLLENISKAQIIKNFEKNRSATKHENLNFQNKFLRRGNFSIQNEMREFEKSRSRSNQKHQNPKHDSSTEHIPVKKSARYENKGNEKQSDNKIGQARQYLKMKKQILKTELKQFSIQLSDGIENASSVYPESQSMQHSDSISLLLKQHKKSKELKSNFKREAMSSATSEKITKLYEQKRREFLRSEAQQELNYSSFDPIIDKPQMVVNQKHNEQELRDSKQKMKLENEKKKMMKKKKLVHSVFPEEFYPLQDSQQIGFHLPKIKSNKQ